MATTCIPFAGGVPAAPGPPRWWDSAGEIPEYNSRLDDPRWRGATSRTYPTGGGGTVEHAVFRALYHETGVSSSPPSPSQKSLYLSWYVEVDPLLNPELDQLYVGFAGAAGTALVVQLSPVATVPPGNAPEMGVPLTGGAAYQYNASQWQTMSDQPDWIGTYGRAWVSSAPSRWAVNLRVPLITSGSVTDAGINLGDTFKMWFQMHVRIPGNAITAHTWPRGAALVSEPDFPAPDVTDEWENFRLGTGPTECRTGVSLAVDGVGTTNAPSSLIQFSRSANPPVVNTFFARPLNTSGGTIPASTASTVGISARFRMANWGSMPDWNDVPDPNQLWADIRGGGDVRNTADIPDGAQGNLTFDWQLNSGEMDQFDPPGGGTPPRRPHQCVLVELSGPGLDFANNSVYRNMDVQELAAGGGGGGMRARAEGGADDQQSRFDRFSRAADVSVVGLPALSRPTRDVYLYVETLNMPREETPSNGDGGTDGGMDGGVKARRTRLQARLLGGGEDDGPISPQELEDYLPTYRVHAFHDTGETYRKGGRTLRVLRPQGSYGYYFLKQSDSYGWDQSLRASGLQEIAVSFYRLPVPHGRAVTVTTRVASWNKPRPWWWWLWEQLVEIWEKTLGRQRKG